MGKIFKDTDELIADPIFQQKVRTEFYLLENQRRNRPEPPAGCYYKRDWYNRMMDNEQFSVSFFLENIKQVWHKPSNLSSEVRGIIKSVCDRAAFETFMHYAKEEQKPEEEVKTEP